MLGGFGGRVLSALTGRRVERRVGEVDRARDRRSLLHWTGGIVLAVGATFALAAVIPALRGNPGSQVLVVMIGMVYFLTGVHFERYYLWLGPVLIAGGVAVGSFPHHGWTGLGVVTATGLLVPALLKGGGESRTGAAPATGE